MSAVALCRPAHLPVRSAVTRRWVLRTIPFVPAGPHLQGIGRHLAPAMAAAASLDVFVKGDPTKSILGDCPFCQRVLLTLEEKKVPYTKEFINFDDKPKWLFEVNPNGSVPVMKDVGADKWVVDSGVITDYLEDKFPEPHLGKSDSIPDVGSKLFPSFVQYLKSSGEEEAGKKEAYLAELKKLTEHLQGGTAYLAGNDVSAADLALAPKIYHAVVALKEFKGLEVPEECQPVLDYLHRMEGRPSWTSTYYPPESVIAGWKRHLAHV